MEPALHPSCVSSARKQASWPQSLLGSRTTQMTRYLTFSSLPPPPNTYPPWPRLDRNSCFSPPASEDPEPCSPGLLPPTKPGIDVCHSLAQCQVNEAPAQAEVREDNKQLPQQGVEPEQRLKHSKAGQSGIGPSPCALLSRVGLGKDCRWRGQAARLSAGSVC